MIRKTGRWVALAKKKDDAFVLSFRYLWNFQISAFSLEVRRDVRGRSTKFEMISVKMVEYIGIDERLKRVYIVGQEEVKDRKSPYLLQTVVGKKKMVFYI